jgi:hypothetical protein
LKGEREVALTNNFDYPESQDQVWFLKSYRL